MGFSLIALYKKHNNTRDLLTVEEKECWDSKTLAFASVLSKLQQKMYYFLFTNEYQCIRVIKPWKRLKYSLMGIKQKQNNADRFHRSLCRHTNPVLLSLFLFSFGYIVAIMHEIHYFSFQILIWIHQKYIATKAIGFLFDLII